MEGCCLGEFIHTTSLNAAAAAKSLQSCPTLCDPIDGSPPGSPIPGIFQARTLEWVAISFSTLVPINVTYLGTLREGDISFSTSLEFLGLD